jgi:hypothetical protein
LGRPLRLSWALQRPHTGQQGSWDWQTSAASYTQQLLSSFGSSPSSSDPAGGSQPAPPVHFDVQQPGGTPAVAVLPVVAAAAGGWVGWRAGLRRGRLAQAGHACLGGLVG